MSSLSWQFTLPQPEPSLGILAYQQEKRLALEGSKRKLENYNHYLQSKRGSRLDYLPVKLDIENVSRCNYRCVMCQVSDWPKGRRAADMSFQDFRQIVDEQYGLVEIKIQGMGEPLMQGDPFFEMIRYARYQHIWVRTNTNASLLHLKNNYKKLVDSGANEIQISIDGAKKETFEKIRRGSKFENVIENCNLINKYAASKNTSPTRMWVVVQKNNEDELNGLVDLAYKLGFRNLVFSLGLVNWGQERWHKINNDLSSRSQMAQMICKDLITRGTSYGLKVSFWVTVGRYSTLDIGRICPWPFERSYISSDMKIVPCCRIANPEIVNMGEANDLIELWNSEIFVKFRKQHINGDIPVYCQNCYRS